MGSAIEMTANNFAEILENNDIVMVDWWAEWCGPCKAFAPVFEKAATENEDIAFAKVNVDQEQDLSGAFQIQSIPTLMVFRDKVLLFSQAGSLPAAALTDIIAQVRGLDMEQVHKEIAEQEAQQKQEKEKSSLII